MNAKRILISPDKFKGTLSASEAAAAMRKGAERFFRELGCEGEFLTRPLADGGEGSHEALKSLDASLIERQLALTSASGTPRIVPFLCQEGARPAAFLETARVIGLELPGSRDLPLEDRRTDGVGEWIVSMSNDFRSAEKLNLHLFLGGSATSDGGFGLARALGFRFLASGVDIQSFRDLDRLNAVELPGGVPTKKLPSFPEKTHDPSRRPEMSRMGEEFLQVFIYTDVQNPLTGPEGAARLFGPQKGADPEAVERIERRLTKMETCLRSASGRLNEEFLGIGAAGGLAAPLLFWPAIRVELKSGSRFFLERSGISELLGTQASGKPIDLVLTGEGRSDRGTLTGKAPAALLEPCRRAGAKLVLISGKLQDADELQAAGFARLFDTFRYCGPSADLKREAAARLEETTYRGLAHMHGANEVFGEDESRNP